MVSRTSPTVWVGVSKQKICCLYVGMHVSLGMHELVCMRTHWGKCDSTEGGCEETSWDQWRSSKHCIVCAEWAQACNQPWQRLYIWLRVYSTLFGMCTYSRISSWHVQAHDANKDRHFSSICVLLLSLLLLFIIIITNEKINVALAQKLQGHVTHKNTFGRQIKKQEGQQCHQYEVANKYVFKRILWWHGIVSK